MGDSDSDSNQSGLIGIRMCWYLVPTYSRGIRMQHTNQTHISRSMSPACCRSRLRAPYNTRVMGSRTVVGAASSVDRTISIDSLRQC